MTEKRFVQDHSYLVNYDKYCILDKIQNKHLYLDEVIDLLNELSNENRQLQKQVAEYDMILRQHEFAEKEGFR